MANPNCVFLKISYLWKNNKHFRSPTHCSRHKQFEQYSKHFSPFIPFVWLQWLQRSVRSPYRCNIDNTSTLLFFTLASSPRTVFSYSSSTTCNIKTESFTFITLPAATALYHFFSRTALPQSSTLSSNQASVTNLISLCASLLVRYLSRYLSADGYGLHNSPRSIQHNVLLWLILRAQAGFPMWSPWDIHSISSYHLLLAIHWLIAGVSRIFNKLKIRTNLSMFSPLW